MNRTVHEVDGVGEDVGAELLGLRVGEGVGLDVRVASVVVVISAIPPFQRTNEDCRRFGRWSSNMDIMRSTCPAENRVMHKSYE